MPSQSEIKDLLTITGGVLGAIAFVWRVWDALISHVKLDLSVAPVNDLPLDSPRNATVSVTIENQAITPKRITYAALLIGPATQPLPDLTLALSKGITTRSPSTANNILSLHKLRSHTILSLPEKESHLVPLPFFYIDNAQVGNEKLKFSVAVAALDLQADRDHRIFLLVYSRELFGLIRYRVTSDLLPRHPKSTPSPALEEICLDQQKAL